jgi:hypothetical protein
MIVSIENESEENEEMWKQATNKKISNLQEPSQDKKNIDTKEKSGEKQKIMEEMKMI